LILITALKYTLHLLDSENGGWPGKAAYLFYLDLTGDLVSMLVFLGFMGVFFVQNPSRLPIYMMADVIQVAKQLSNRLRNFRKYLLIMKDFDEKFRKANVEDCEKAETCIICRDELKADGDGSSGDGGGGSEEGDNTSVILPCGHVFHADCLKSWIVMQQVCPTCRSEIPIDRAKLEAAYIKAGRPKKDVKKGKQSILLQEDSEKKGETNSETTTGSTSTKEAEDKKSSFEAATSTASPCCPSTKAGPCHGKTAAAAARPSSDPVYTKISGDSSSTTSAGPSIFDALGSSFNSGLPTASSVNGTGAAVAADTLAQIDKRMEQVQRTLDHLVAMQAAWGLQVKHGLSQAGAPTGPGFLVPGRPVTASAGPSSTAAAVPSPAAFKYAGRDSTTGALISGDEGGLNPSPVGSGAGGSSDDLLAEIRQRRKQQYQAAKKTEEEEETEDAS